MNYIYSYTSPTYVISVRFKVKIKDQQILIQILAQ